MSAKGSRHVIKKIPAKDLERYVEIVANAYPGFKIVTPDDRAKMKQRLVNLITDPTIVLYGTYRGRELIGGMCTYGFTMNLFSVPTLVGGVGLVAVDLLHKKERACREMISYFIDLYMKKDSALVALYPFRPDFYRMMGFGYGIKTNLYKIRPGDIPRGESKRHVRFLKTADRQSFIQCAHRFFLDHHGMFEMKKHEIEPFFTNPELKTIVYEDARKINGYVSFNFKRIDEDNLLRNDIVVRHLVYENEAVLSELLAFLHTQLDQIHRVQFSTQDEFFHFLPRDTRDGSDSIIPLLAHQTNTQGIGIMYRIIDARRAFQLLHNHNFGNQNYRLGIVLHDAVTGKVEDSLTVGFKDGRPALRKDTKCDVRIDLNVADFSSLFVGAVDYHSLQVYGLSRISDRSFIDTVTNTFRAEVKPICHTIF